MFRTYAEVVVVDDIYPVLWEDFNHDRDLFARVEQFCSDIGNFIVETGDGRIVWKEMTALCLGANFEPKETAIKSWGDRFDEYINLLVEEEIARDLKNIS